MRVLPFLPMVLLAGAGCLGNKDPAIPGDALGTYHVIANLSESTCGVGALGSTAVWEFDVRLSREDDQLYWLNGQSPVAGDLAKDGKTFSVSSQSRVDARAATNSTPGCSVVRTDQASGVLDDDGTTVKGFDGLLQYGYTTVSGSDCVELIGVEGGFEALPCSIQYATSATRTGQ